MSVEIKIYERLLKVSVNVGNVAFLIFFLRSDVAFLKHVSSLNSPAFVAT